MSVASIVLDELVFIGSLTLRSGVSDDVFMPTIFRLIVGCAREERCPGGSGNDELKRLDELTFEPLLSAISAADALGVDMAELLSTIFLFDNE